MTCPRCEGLGWFVLIYKHRSLGMTTALSACACHPSYPAKMDCPDCKGTGKLNT